MSKVTLLILIGFLLLPKAVEAQEVAGIWYGTLTLSGGETLELKFTITPRGTDYEGEISSSLPTLPVLPIDSIGFDGRIVSIGDNNQGYRYEGELFPDEIRGVLLTPWGSLPLIFRRRIS